MTEMPQPNEQDVRAQPLPADLQQMLSQGRGQYYSDAGQMYDRIVEPYILVIKSILWQMEQAKQMAQKQAKPNRAARRAKSTRIKKTKS